MEPTVTIDDDELARQALAADPDMPVADDAVPFEGMNAQSGYGLLPGWYMPSPAARSGTVGGWRRVVAFVVIAALVTIVAFGLCSTDGYVAVA